MEQFQSLLNRIEQGELDPGDNFSERTKQFAKEVIINAQQGFLTEKQAVVLWLHYLRRLGHHVEIPDNE
ncbi:MAG: hypothetical protein WC837_08630 [Bellilinea sp.]